MTGMLAMTKAYRRDVPVIAEFRDHHRCRGHPVGGAYYPHDRLLSEMRFRRRGVFYAGGLQLDRYGNST